MRIKNLNRKLWAVIGGINANRYSLVELIDYLNKNELDNSPDSKGQTVLHHLMLIDRYMDEEKCILLAQILDQYSIDINAKNSEGLMAFDLAIDKRCFKTAADILLMYNAKINPDIIRIGRKYGIVWDENSPPEMYVVACVKNVIQHSLIIQTTVDDTYYSYKIQAKKMLSTGIIYWVFYIVIRNSVSTI